MSEPASSGFDRALAEARFGELASEWEAIRLPFAGSASISDWQEAFQRMRTEMTALVAAGQWFSGPADMMRLLGVDHEELKHSRMVGWLFTPTGRHGLDDDLLRRLLRAGWGEPLPDSSAATVELEVPRGSTRADIVVYIGDVTLVIENKVWSPEGLGQCEALFAEWSGFTDDVRFLLLSRDGGPPRSTCSEDAATAWRAISYSALATHLAASLAEHSERRAEAEPAARQYLTTLRATIGRASTFEIVKGGHGVGPV